MKTVALSFAFSLLGLYAFSQTDVMRVDTSSLNEVIIRGYESQRRTYETPASVAVLQQRDMDRYAPVNMLPGLNTIPGVRMEERSPGSYRLSLRGSLMRSPFGIRNVKIYWNEIPFTDAGGNTYFNLVDQSGVQQIEILKGPGGSLYGANTGGVLLMNTDEPPTGNSVPQHNGEVQVTGGSYGLLGEHAKWKFSNADFSSSLTQSHLQSDGYRDNTKLRRDVLQWSGAARTSDNNQLNWIVLYADMFYRTPGGLTLQQMQDNPRQSRPNAIEQKAAIYNKTIMSGISNRYKFNDHWSNTTSLMYAYTDFKNPFLFNYETRAENNLGLRSKFTYQNNWDVHAIKLTGGAEWLWNQSRIINYGNRQGVQDTVQYKDVLGAGQFFPFVQAEWLFGNKFQLQLGTSTNIYSYNYRRLTDADDSKKTKDLKNQVLPRLAALYRLSNKMSLYASASKGFSPPTIAEIRPSEGSIYDNLQPEYGWNYELGIKGITANNRLQFDVSVYQFKLKDAIVRRQADFGEYFSNAGGTDQKGMEFYIEYLLLKNKNQVVREMRIWGTATLNDYRFVDYKVDDKDHSGKRLTGVARQIAGMGLDVNTKWGLGLSGSYLYTSKLPLMDDNSVSAPAYRLLAAKLSWKKEFNATSITLFAGIDNALNQLYSLGNDINAAGNRFYNPASIKNYYGGIAVKL